MTLFKEVAILVSLVILLLILATTAGDLRRTGVFLEGQLQTAAQDMTTTLGIAISNSANGSDKATLETLFNAVFDSGYYTSIELIAPDGSLIHRKEQVLQIEGVPDWFINMVPLSPAQGTTQVMNGWVPLGKLTLTLHPGYAYIELYKSLQSTLMWSMVLFIVGMILLWMMLRIALKPLDKVREQAEAIHRNEFIHQASKPRTVELKSVVEAMNRMVAKVQTVFDEQQKTLTRYQKLLYIDNLTGLGNRKHMLARLEHARTEGASFNGSFVVIRIQALDGIRERLGYEMADKIVQAVANTLNDLTGNMAHEESARLSDEEFAMLVPVNIDSTRERIHTLYDRFRILPEIANIKDGVVLVSGMTTVHAGRETGEILAEADFALTQAVTKGPYSIVEMDSTGLVLPQGKMQWRHYFEESFESRRFYLVAQPVLDDKRQIIQREVFVRLKNEQGQIIPAGMFIPMAISLGLGQKIDKLVFDLVSLTIRQTRDVPLAVNLTETFFSSTEAYDEFNHLLEQCDHSQAPLCVESSHSVIQNNLEVCTQVVQRIRQTGQTFGIDNLDLGLSLQLLQVIRPDYVKINARTIYDITSDAVAAGFQALKTMTDTLDIRIIAVGVDSQDLYDHVLEIGVHAAQGNLLAEPEELA